MADITEAALKWYDAGYHVIAAKPGKRPADNWREYQNGNRIPRDQLIASLKNADGFGIITGTHARIEMLEVEGRAIDTIAELKQLAADNGMTELLNKVLRSYRELTPTAGFHWYYRVDGTPRGNRKLARRPGPVDGSGRPTVEVLWETRGQGGFTVVAPSAGSTHGAIPNGQWIVAAGTIDDIPTLTEDDRDQLHALIGMLDRMPTTDGPATTTVETHGQGDGLRPGDQFNATANWDEILTPHGWTKVGTMGNGFTWRRPGKPAPGISATTGQAKDGVDRLYVFSTSTPFDSEKPYSKFAAFAVLNHGGNYTEAVRALRARGFGANLPPWPPEAPAPTAGAEDAPATPYTLTTDPETENAVFGATPVLEHVRQAARARMVGPWGVLGAVLARVLAEVPPHVALPAIIGGRAPLNLFVAMVGESGESKTATVTVAKNLLDFGAFPLATLQGIGTGEGLMASFLKPDPDDKRGGYVLADRPHVFMKIDEIEQLEATQARQGSTLAAVLRSAWSGDALATNNAEATRKRYVPDNSYRLTVVAGVQPLLSAALFKDVSGGTPQRWIWLPVRDALIGDTEPEWPGVLPWRLPNVNGGARDHHGHVTIAVPEDIKALVKAVHRAKHRGQDTGGLDGHLMLTRLKVAAALSLLHGLLEITPLSWELAGRILAVSTEAREHCQAVIAAKRNAEQAARGRQDAARKAAEAGAVAEALAGDAARVRAVVVAHASGELATAKHGAEAGCTRRCITQRFGRRTPEQRDAAIAEALDMGWIDADADRYRPGQSSPAK
jgi:hypothetical protein